MTSPRKTGPYAGIRVLVVDDDEVVRRFLGRSLGGLGFEVTLAQDAREALHALRAATRKFALMISDVVMPDMTGTELVEFVFLDAPELRVLFITGNDGETRREAAALGPVLDKPFTLDELLDAVRRALSI